MKLWLFLHLCVNSIYLTLAICHTHTQCFVITISVTSSGRIKAIQLEYSEARRTLTNALRKAPQHTAVGFKQTVSVALCVSGCWCWAVSECGRCLQVHKLLIVVELLLGEIPDRLQFRQPSLKRSLMPYFLLTQGNSAPTNTSALLTDIASEMRKTPFCFNPLTDTVPPVRRVPLFLLLVLFLY